jgi:hypothetical protein
MNLNYKLVTTNNQTAITACKHLYKEETAVFAYYVITGLLVNNYIEFMNWCLSNNTSFLLFHKTPTNISRYIELIKKSTEDMDIKYNIKKIENRLMKMDSISKLSPIERNMMMSLKMSILDNSSVM